MRNFFLEQKVLETRLSSSRQLLISQEENLRSKDQQQKSLKGRLLSADLHVRDKEAKIASLNNLNGLLEEKMEQTDFSTTDAFQLINLPSLFCFKDLIASLKYEISKLEEDKKSLKETVSLFELERVKTDSLQRQTDDELLKYRSEITALHNKKEELSSRLKETEEQLAASQKCCSELEKSIREYRNTLQKMKKDAGAWKKQTSSGNREEDEMEKQHLIDRLQLDLEEALLKQKALVKEKESLKKELNTAKAHQNRSAQKITELQQTICTLSFENSQTKQRLAVLEKVSLENFRALFVGNRVTQKDGNVLGNVLHEELEQLRADKISYTSERHNLRKRIERAESERRELEAQRVRLERERAALKQHIEALEIEKQKSDTVTKQTNIERLALDKSLSAMEKENRELYKNCSQLQKQIAQLEKENGSYLLNDSANQRRHVESQLQRVTAEKQELERKLKQCEQLHTQSVKLLESKLNSLKKQLDVERKRRGISENHPVSDTQIQGELEARSSDVVERQDSKVLDESDENDPPVPKSYFKK
ncbi:unnamed protein product [Enterobius vermicularis]|uniref:Uncharacterized protein n=1 Tax=Enterobius vermicularis TaxID=51028 RepID=A0A3P6HGM6_ENTVE|nr:unnamed protein product [Enterobius vermicularis]